MVCCRNDFSIYCYGREKNKVKKPYNYPNIKANKVLKVTSTGTKSLVLVNWDRVSRIKQAVDSFGNKSTEIYFEKNNYMAVEESIEQISQQMSEE